MKRILLIIIAFLLILTIIQPANATIQLGKDNNQVLYTTTGKIISTGTMGTTFVANGTITTRNGTIGVYWDKITPWDPQSSTGQLAKTKSTPEGVFKVELKAPAATYGPHYVFIRDETTSELASYIFQMRPLLKLNTQNLAPGDRLDTQAYGFNQNSRIQITLLNPTTKENTFLTQITDSNPPITDQTGTLITTLTIPSTLKKGDYTITVKDELGRFARLTITLATTLKVSTSSTTSGSVVTLTGSGYTPNTALSSRDITIDGIPCPTKTKIQTTATGSFTAEIIIPTLAVGTHTIKATDGTNQATTTIKTTQNTQLTTKPTTAGPGETLTLTGKYYTTLNGTKITLKINDQIFSTNATVDAKGQFTTTITLPDTTTPQVTITATDAYNLTATAAIQSAITILIQPTAGPPGTQVTLTTRGLNTTNGGSYTATFNGAPLIEPTNLNGSTTLNTTFHVPSLPKGKYKVEIRDLTTNKTRQATFQITITSTLTVLTKDPWPTKNVTIQGAGFASIYPATLTITNSDWTATVTTTKNGNFTTTITIPPNLTPGSYKLRSTTTTNQKIGITQFAETTLKIIEDPVNATTTQTNYNTTQTATLTASAYQPKPGYTITLKDASGNTAYTENLTTMNWAKQGPYWTHTASYALPADASPGTWTWELRDPQNTLKKTVKITVNKSTTPTGIDFDYSQISYYVLIGVVGFIAVGTILYFLKKRGLLSISIEIVNDQGK
jgi:hypothetical protein